LKKDLFSFSIQQAETLGLECAIVLAAVKELDSITSPETISKNLATKITFLNEQEIKKHLKRLSDLKLISSQINSKLKDSQNTRKLYRLKLPDVKSNIGKRKLDNTWGPSTQVFEVLYMGNIPKEFIMNKVNEFKVFWLEKNQVRDNWDTLFIKFIRVEWAKANSKNKGLPVCIDEQWSPSSDVFDILELSNVSKIDALKHLKEFILYWKENGAVATSWNSKFVDFVKRRESISSYEQKNDKKNYRHNEPGEFSKEFSERTKDNSWAENIKL
tara:strand:+ start:177 stop:992 length:816 start_codon:yes stop_codon:yes gene_type:complete